MRHLLRTAVAVAALALALAPTAAAVVHAQLDHLFAVGLPATTASVPAGQSFTTGFAWGAALKNGGGGDITNPTLTFSTGYPASDLELDFSGVPLTTTPVVVTDAGTGGGGFGSSHLLDSRFDASFNPFIPVTFAAGCNWSRSLATSPIPLGGGGQTISVAVTCVDPSVQQLMIVAGVDDLAGVGVESASESLGVDAPFLQKGGVAWTVENVVPGVEYDASATFSVPNPFGVPFLEQPRATVFETAPQPGGCDPCSTGSSLTIADATLDGGTPGAGAVTYSVDEPGQSWAELLTETHKLQLSGTRQSGLTDFGPASATSGQPATLYAGWNLGPAALDGTPVTFTVGSQSCTAPSGYHGHPGLVACPITFAQAPGTYTVQISSGGDAAVYPATASGTITLLPPSSIDQCTNGLWSAFRIFKNQGDCVSYVATHGRNAAG